MKPVENDPLSSPSVLLQDAVLDSTDVRGFLNSLAVMAAKQLSTEGAPVLCGVTLLRPRRMATVASSSVEAEKMDELQYEHNDGPCLRAAREEKVYRVEDFRAEDRFGGYSTDIAEHGMLSAIGVPIVLDGEANAGLNLYSPRAQGFDDAAVEKARAFARDTSNALRMAVRIADLTDHSKDLKTAMQSRTIIDLAAGIIMSQNRCSQEEAVTILKMASSSRNLKLSAVAAAVVESVTRAPINTHFN
jgi:transcriptional regulator with GAF, ATPase, and Fis domain